MPGITIQGPPIKDLDIKRVLVKELTDAASKAYKMPKEKIHVLIKENLPENVGAGGELIIDRRQRNPEKQG